MINESIRELIRKYVLINSVKFGGKPRANAVLGKIIAEKPALKNKAKELLQIIQQVINEIKSIPLEKQRELIRDFLESKRKEKEIKQLPPLPNVEKYRQVVMRLAPFPSGPLHLGNARMVILNDEYVKRYNGKLLLVYDDTIGSEEKTIFPEAYDLIKEGLDWLGVKYHETYYKSDRLPIFYKWCKVLIKQGDAYVCKCDPKKWRTEHKLTGIPCKCRSNSFEENLEEWDRMLEGYYKEGEAAVRLKTNMKHEDPALRDNVIMRISDKSHPRVGGKYHVWPLLEFSWAIDDHLLGITHILRGKDLIKEDILEKLIWDKLGWPYREFIHYGRIKFKGLSLSKSKAAMRVRKGEYDGWTDPRTWSLQSLMIRGFKPEAIRQAILELGLSATDIEYSPSKLYAINRGIIDSEANRLFYVAEPKEIEVKNVPDSITKATPPWHIDFPDRGYREIFVDNKDNKVKVLIDIHDFQTLKTNLKLRLKDLFNIQIQNIDNYKASAIFLSKTVEEGRKQGVNKIIHWVPANDNVNTEIIMPEGNISKGVAESNILSLTAGCVVQFERFGFARLHEINKKLRKVIAYYAHP